MGPDVLRLVEPSSLGDAMTVLVGMAVSVILFEGSMGLDLGELRRQSLLIRRLLTEGALVTATGAAGAAWVFLGWGWSLAVSIGKPKRGPASGPYPARQSLSGKR